MSFKLMSSQPKKWVVLLAAPLLFALAVTVCFADKITLKSGGVLNGKVTNAGNDVIVTTADGIRVVVERSNIERMSRAATPDKTKLTSAEKAWLPKIRKLISRIEFGDGESRRLALRDLRAINDPAAIPALMQTLRTSDDDSSRLLYVHVLGDMPGSKAVIGLVEEALFDTSAPVREAAQEASKNLRADYVRPFYGQALRFPHRDVVLRAADVLATVGNRENVPYLIDALYSRVADVDYRPSCCMSRVNYLASPRGNPYVSDNPISHGDVAYAAVHLRPVVVIRTVRNPQVKDALEAITKQSFGYNTAEWTRWWKAEQLAENTKGR